MSRYVTLSSHVQKSEFPDNGPSEFKVRLPNDRVWQKDVHEKTQKVCTGSIVHAVLSPCRCDNFIKCVTD